MTYLPSNKAGFGLIEIIVAMGLVGILSLAAASLMSQMQSTSTSAGIKLGMFQLQQDVMNTFLDDRSLDQSLFNQISRLPSIACFVQPGASCPNGSETTLHFLMRFDPNQAYTGDWMNDQRAVIDSFASAGFTRTWGRCNSFTVQGNDQCPFQPSITLQARCPGPPNTPCTNGTLSHPMIFYRLQLQYKPSPNSSVRLPPLNMSAFGTSEFKLRFSEKDYLNEALAKRAELECSVNGGIWQPPTDTMPTGVCLMSKALCEKLLGTWDDVAKTCHRDVADNCPTGERMIGFNPDWSPICQKLVTAKLNMEDAFTQHAMDCGPGRVAHGFTSDGNLICALPLRRTLAGDLIDSATCPDDQKAISIREDGTPVCMNTIKKGFVLENGANRWSNCPDGYKAVGVSPTGEAICRLTLGEAEASGTNVCPAGKIVSKIHADGSVTCTSDVNSGKSCYAIDMVLIVKQSTYKSDRVEFFCSDPETGDRTQWRVQNWWLDMQHWNHGCNLFSDCCLDRIESAGDRVTALDGACQGITSNDYFRYIHVNCCPNY